MASARYHLLVSSRMELLQHEMMQACEPVQHVIQGTIAGALDRFWATNPRVDPPEGVINGIVAACRLMFPFVTREHLQGMFFVARMTRTAETQGAREVRNVLGAWFNALA